MRPTDDTTNAASIVHLPEVVMARTVSSMKHQRESHRLHPQHQLRGVVAVGLGCLLALTACGTQKASSGDQLPVLHIGQSSQALGAPAAMDSKIAASGWVFNGTEPVTPASGPVLRYDSTAAAEAQVSELATSLGLTNAPIKHAHGWEVSSSTSTLRVRENGEWAYARETGPCAGVYLDIDSADGNSAVACADGSVSVASGSVSNTAPGAGTGLAMGTTAAPDPAGIVPPAAPTAAPTAPSATITNAPVECGPAVDCVPVSPPTECGPAVDCVPISPPTCVGGPAVDCGPVSLPPAVPDATALAAATPIIKAAHLAGTPFVAPWGGSPATVLIDPTIAGLPTSGVQTSISVDDKGVMNGYGRIGTPVELGQYPIISATAALTALNGSPRPEIAIACPTGDANPPAPSGASGVGASAGDASGAIMGCVNPPLMILTSAVFGLQLQWDGVQPLLVPAWLYTPEGSTTSSDVIGSIAVDPTYIAQPTPIAVPSMSTAPMPLPVSSAGGSSGSVGTASSGPVTGTPGTVTASAQTYTDNGDQTLTLHFWGGNCSTYSADAKESDASVTVFITDTPTNPGGMCDMMAKATDVLVKLSAPLGSRTVIDGPSGATLTPGTAPK